MTVDLATPSIYRVDVHRVMELPSVTRFAALPGAAPPTAAASRPRSESGRALANEVLAVTGYELTFEVDDQLDRVIVQLVDRKTREVVRQLPSEAALEIARAIAGGTAAGLLLYERA